MEIEQEIIVQQKSHLPKLSKQLQKQVFMERLQKTYGVSDEVFAEWMKKKDSDEQSAY